MKIRFILPVLVLLSIVSTGMAQNWRGLTSGTTTVLNSVRFISGSTGFAFGGNVVVKTTNGGTSWAPATGVTAGNAYTAMHFANSTGWLVGDVLTKTTDGGVTWTSQKTTAMTLVTFRAVFAASATTAYVVGASFSPAGGAIYKTTDGGTNWVSQTSGTTNTLNGVYCTDVNTCFIAANATTLLKTTNGGANWVAKTVPAGNYNAIHFTSATTGYAGGLSGTSAAIKTTDAGETWATQTTSTTSNGFQAIHFPDANTGYGVGVALAGSNTIRKTTNGGTTWTVETVDTAGVGLVTLTGVHCTGLSTCYAVGSGGKILMTGTAVPVLSWRRPYLTAQNKVVTVFDLQGRKTHLYSGKPHHAVYAVEFENGTFQASVPFGNR
ncbi:MAG TPA: hypothetical protein DCQ83_08425 [Fibrobacteres bacterium]|jgi:photosystem II stability/assembly factor-like uncharacterized protein|nr:hypothetical protein [Fibrobacterota bacterium]